MTAKSQQFLNELAQFYRNKGQHNVTSENLIVRLNGKPVNLFELYSSVIELGGSYKVNQYNKWEEIYLKLFKPQPLGTNVSVALKQIYLKYLIAYEKVNYSNFMSDTLNDDDDENTNKDINSSFGFQFNNQVASYHHQQQPINKLKLNPLSKLFCSLMSDLPNEMDFGLRVATILTNSEKIDNLADFRFIDVIIECCALYVCDCERADYSRSTDYQFEDELFINSQNKQDLLEKLNIINKDKNDNQSKANVIVTSSEHKENVCDKVIKSVSTKFNFNNVRKFVPFKDCNCFVKFWCQMIRDQELLKMIFDLTDNELDRLYDENFSQEVHQKNYYKIKRIVCLLNNISYSIEKLRQDQLNDHDELSKVFNGANDNASINLLRLFILLLNSDDQFFINTALDCISNISPLVNSSLPPLDQNTYVKLLTSIYEWCVQKVLNSSDVNCLNRSLEIISKLVNSNHEAINRLIISEVFNQTEFFHKLTELLTCQHDVGLVVSTLECCLSLSENYPKLLLTDNKHLVKMLINLINCEEGQYFSPNSIKKVKIIDERRIEYHPPQIIIQQQPLQQHQQQQQQPTQTIYIQQHQPSNQTATRTIQLTDHNSVAILADNEQHVKKWLYANFEPKPMNTSIKSILKLNELYSDYVKHSCANGRRNVVTNQTFSNLIKKFFPLCTFINSNEVDGLILKLSINRVNIHTKSANSGNLASPILKAHLSTPPKSTSSNQNVNPSIINSSNSNQQQLVNGPTTTITTTATASPLIKNLLANKLRNNQTPNSNSDETKSMTTNLVQQPNSITIVSNHQQLTNHNNIIFTTNSNTLSNGNSNGPNLITVPIQQHNNPIVTSSSMIINANQLTNAGTMFVPTSNAGGGQILLVRTILPQQANNSLVGSTTHQQPMRLILPASVLNSQSQYPQTITINGTTAGALTLNSFSKQQQQSSDNKSNQQQSNDNQLIKAVLGSNSSNNSLNISSTNEPVKTVSSNVKSSPLLNVLLDKGKLPEFSTVSNDNVQDKTASNNLTSSINKSIVVTSKFDQIISKSLTTNSSSFVNSTPTSIATQIVASTVNNSNPNKLFILTTTKSPLTINSTVGQTIQTSTATPIQSFVIQQSTNTTNSNQTNVHNQPKTQYILQQQNPKVIITQPLIVTQQSATTNLSTSTVQNPKIDQPTITASLSNDLTIDKVSNLVTTNTNNISIKTINHNSEKSPNKNGEDGSIEKTNCVSKIENGETDQFENSKQCTNEEPSKQISISNEPSKEISISKEPSKEISISKENTPVLTNGCLEKEHLDNNSINDNVESMQCDETKEKNSLLKRQLESNDTLVKRLKAENSHITIIPVQTIKTEPQQQLKPPLLNSQIKASNPVLNNQLLGKTTDTITVTVNSNGILSNQSTISNNNNLIKSALNSSLPKTNLTPTCTIEKITISRPNIINNNSELISTNSFKITPIPAPVPSKIEFICEWSNCKKSFAQASSVFLHVHKDHINQLDGKPTKCLWGSPDGTGPGCKSLRPKYSLLTHLQDFHCGVQQLQQAAQRNQQLLTKGISDIPQIIPPAHPGYANNAAYIAIKRHSTNYVETRPIANISPLSKSVRLTAAMILRNLAQHSNSIKRLLKKYESYLSELCVFDGREDSRTLAQCLAVITEEN